MLFCLQKRVSLDGYQVAGPRPQVWHEDSLLGSFHLELNHREARHWSRETLPPGSLPGCFHKPTSLFPGLCLL